MNLNARLGAGPIWGGRDRACPGWFRLWLFLALVAVFPSRGSAQFQELIVDGDFDENGRGWALTVTNNPNNGQPGCGVPPQNPDDPGVPATGCWFLNGPGFRTPLTGLPTSVTPEHGTYVITDMTVIGTRALYQSFFVPQANRRVTLSFDLFVNDWASLTSFDERQFARVDLMTNTAPAFDLTPTGVLFNAYVGTDGGPLPNAFRHYEFDISPFVAATGNYRIRIMGHNIISSGIPLNVGVDNVSVLLVPEPGTLGLSLGGVAVILVAAVRRHVRVRRRCS
jgi:hypothetical protein